MGAVFITGASGLIGKQVLALLQGQHVYALSRQRQQSDDIVWLEGDLMCDGLALSREHRHVLARDVTTVIHIAANTTFSQTLEQARAINTEGTRRLLALSADWPRVSRWVYVSTAFVAGLRTGRIIEADGPASRCANPYEQSKGEAEHLVRAARHDWTVVRPATIVCDDESGCITQYNAVHRALRLYFGGLAAMMPGTDESRVDVITNEYAARGVALAATSPDVQRRTLHLCAGDGAMPLDELLDITYDVFRRSPEWSRKGIVRPIRRSRDVSPLRARCVRRRERQGEACATLAGTLRATARVSQDVRHVARRYAVGRSRAGQPVLAPHGGAPRRQHGAPSAGGSVNTRQQFMSSMLAWLNARLAPPGVHVTATTPLFASGLISSIKVLELIAFTERAIGRKIADKDIRLDNFCTVERIAAVFVTETDHAAA